MVKSLDEVEDLTRFADESFDTDDVDLFEFTGIDDSPLTRLKSVILSLDWEINDEILDELLEEVENLRSMWKDDKVAQVYLQGMDKVGKYLKAEGAYAHHNAIKLLLTLFYNFEKIISSPDISGDAITTLLKSDIRKFKVLQYQIGKKDLSTEKISTVTVDKDTSVQESNPLLNLEATILGLDWEVTNEGLDKYNKQTEDLLSHFTDNNHALVLIQGLKAIGSYIKEEKAKAHPDSFTLLHSFFDSLKILVADNDLDSAQRQELVIGQVSQLNRLKELIADNVPQDTVERSEENVDQILDLEDLEQKEVIVTDSQPEQIEASESVEEVEETIESPASDDDFEFDFDFDDNLTDLPAGEPETDGDVESVASFSNDEDNDFVLDIEENDQQINAAMETADEKYPDEILDPAAIQPVSDSIADEFIEDELSISSKWRSGSDDAEEVGLTFDTDDKVMNKEDLDDELELIFSDDAMAESDENSNPTDELFGELELSFDDEEPIEVESDTATVESADLFLNDNSDTDDSLDFDQDLFLSEEDEEPSSTVNEEFITPALDDTDEDGGFTEELESAELSQDTDIELEDKLDSFFGVSEENESELFTSDEELVTPALDDANEEAGFSEDFESVDLGEEPAAELEDKLDSFFGLSEEESDIEPPSDTVFSEMETSDEAEEDTVVAALTDTEEPEEGGFRESDVVAEFENDPTDDIQDKLDSFFGSEDGADSDSSTEQSTVPLDDELDSFFAEDQASETVTEDDATLPALADAAEGHGFDEEEAVTDLTGSSMEELDDKLDSFFETDEEESDQPPLTTPSVLSSLVTTATSLSSTPETKDLKQVVDLIAAAKDENHSFQQNILLTLLDSASVLLSKKQNMTEGGNVIIQELVAGLEDADNPTVLVELVGRYTSWQQEFFDAALSGSRKEAADTSAPSTAVTEDEVIELVHTGFNQLRESLNLQFESLKEELKKE